jgi:hypothetical protein
LTTDPRTYQKRAFPSISLTGNGYSIIQFPAVLSPE